MSPRAKLPPLPAREKDLIAPVRAHLEAQGWRVWPDPDGEDYFDLAARRGDEVGLIELKKTDWKTLLRQAMERRVYADWVAVVLPRRTATERLRARASGPSLQPIGIWTITDGRLEELRPATPWPEETRALFPEHRAALRRLLDHREAGTASEGIAWSSFARWTRSAGGGRSAREWRLDEFPEDAPPKDGA